MLDEARNKKMNKIRGQKNSKYLTFQKEKKEENKKKKKEKIEY
jgi:hypothetical protein